MNNACRFRAALSLSILALLLVGCGLRTTGGGDDRLHMSTLRCEYLTDPLGIGETSPRLSWMLDSTRRGERQGAYQVLVASSRELLNAGQGDLWDSGKITSDESAHVLYAGKALTSRTACYWKVRIWSSLNDSADPCPWSEPAIWTMGLLSPTDWQAKWIDSSAASHAAEPVAPVTILHATYAAVDGNSSKDVTAKIASLVKAGWPSIVVNPLNMGTYPAPAAARALTVRYEQGGAITESTAVDGEEFHFPAPQPRVWSVRKDFPAPKAIRSATLYATALGLYEITLNGHRVGDAMLAPDWTDYNKRIRYQAYDVTKMLNRGSNEISALLANGWYAGHIGNGGFQQYGKIPALFAQLEITYADGSTQIVTTDESWKTAPSPILSTDFLLGESYDARMENAASTSQWLPVTLREEASRPLDSQVAPPVRETGTVHTSAITEPAPGHWTFDLGQNIVGVVRLKISAPAGSTIKIRHAEVLNPDGTLYTDNLRKAAATDTYICKGTGTETWQPRFTFHGFRYVELTGLPKCPSKDAVTGVVWGTDSPRTGSFTCSDPRINQLVSNIEWGQRGNYLSVPTDCPQRDERLGWMGDAEVFVRTATDNADIASFFTKWLVDVDDAQRPDGAFTDVSPWCAAKSGTPAWGDAGVICPWTIYLAYGDTRILERHLPAMTRWVDWCHTHSTDNIRDKDRGGDYGDWLAIGEVTPKELIGTAYYAYSTHLLAKSYEALGNSEQAAKYNQLFDEIKAAFNKKYVSPDARITGDTQSCYLMALKFELLPEALRPLAAQHLEDDIRAKNDHLATGFVGVSFLLPTLTAAGKVDTAYKLLLQDTFPSWLFSIKQGATTIWERWDGYTPDKGFQTPEMNSFNHYSLGSCGEWLYDSVAGIDWDPQHPGYKHILLHPVLGQGLTSATASIRSPYGKIKSAWKLEGETLTLNITIPPNSTATLSLPSKPGAPVTESNTPAQTANGIKFLRSEPDHQLFDLQSGTYSFKTTAP